MATQTPLGYYTVALHGRYYQPTFLGRAFRGGNQAAVATALTAGLPTTYTGGLVLYNPASSGVNLAINQASYAFVVAQTNASMIGLGVGYSASALAGTLTAVASEAGFVNSSPATAQGLLYSSASITLPVAPYLACQLGVVDTGALTTGPNGAAVTVDLGGSIILGPGAYACFLSSAAGTASSFLGAFAWEENPLS